MNPHVFILSAIALTLLTLGTLMMSRYQKSSSIIYYSVMFFALALLALITVVINVTRDPVPLLFFTRLGYFVGIIVFSMMLMFSYYYPFPKKMPRRAELFWVVPIAFFFPLSLLSTALIESVEKSSGTVRQISGTAFFIFPLLIMTYFVLTVRNLTGKFSMVQGEQKKYLNFVTLGLALGAGSAIIFDALFPLLGFPQYHFISIEVSSVLVGCTAYIVAKK